MSHTCTHPQAANAIRAARMFHQQGRYMAFQWIKANDVPMALVTLCRVLENANKGIK